MPSKPDQDRLGECFPIMHLRLWLDTDDGLLFGTGRAVLLNEIERHGSLRKAAEVLGISYRAAWGKIKRTEEALGFKIIDKSGSYKEGYRLTEAGRALKENFDRWYKEVTDEALAKARVIFACESITPEKQITDHLEADK